MTVGAEPQQRKGLLEWCRDAAAPAEVRYTVTVLIAYLETDDCATAARSLATEDRLDLENYAVTREFGLDEYRPPPPTFAQMIAERPVRDLRPISGMTNLRVLNLDGNQIDDRAPLAGLRAPGSRRGVQGCTYLCIPTVRTVVKLGLITGSCDVPR